MNKTEAKAAAKDTLKKAIGAAYYRISDSNDYSEEEANMIIEYINKYGAAACKAFNETYIAY